MMIDPGKIGNGFTNDIMVWYHDNESFYCEVKMMARNYSREYELRKTKDKAITAHIPPQDAEDFKAKCALDGFSVNTFIKACVYAYLDNSLTYENGKLNMK